MTRLDILNDINEFSTTNDIKKIINVLNKLLSDNEYIDQYMDLILIIIDSAQLYGYTKYIDSKIENYIFNNEVFQYRRASYDSQLFEYLNCGQLSLLQEIENNQKLFISAPTSFGKTSLINEYILKNRSLYNQILYIVPTNSLTEELFNKLVDLNIKYHLGFRISTRQSIIDSEKNLLILTPERFLLFLEKYDVNFFNLIIMDEAYKILNESNDSINDFVNNRAYKFRKTIDIIASSLNKVIFLSPYTYKFDESMNKFIKRYNITPINRKLEYVNHELVLLRTRKNISEYFNIKECGGFYSGDSVSKKVSFILEYLKNDKNIVYVSGYDKAYEILDKYESRIEISDRSIRFKKFYSHLISKYTTDNLEVWKVIQGLEKGIGIYISPIPRYIKKELVNLYNNDELNTFIVTTSFVEGVNTNAKNIIVTSQYTAKNKSLSELDLLNIAGRAGRFGEHSIGKIITVESNVYDRLSKIYESIIQLSNPNYEYSETIRNDYAIDMIQDSYLNKDEIAVKEKLNNIQNEMKLSDIELNKSLNVSKRWKIILYQYFNTLSKTSFILKGDIIKKLIDSKPGEVANSLEEIFNDIRIAFENTQISCENPFTMSISEIPPFNKKQEFVWKKLYINHSFNNMSDILKHKKIFIENIRRTIVEKYDMNRYEFSFLLELENLKWASSYFDSHGNIKDSAIYTETFKFISNVMQYKIPFYINYYVSMYELCANKKYKCEEVSLNLDPMKIAMYFENGNLTEDLQQMYDYGIPLELLKRINKDNIAIKDVIKTKGLLDEYETIILKDYLKIFSEN